MALERSVLDESKIVSLLKQHYGLNIIAVKRLRLGTANCYRVFDGNRYYFLKEFQSIFNSEDITREATLVKFLLKRGFPVADFIFTVANKPFFTYDSHFICLEEYIEGNTYEYNDFPQSLLFETASTLGKLHHVLKDFSLPKDMDEKWLESYSSDEAIKQYNELIEIATTKSEDENCTRIVSDLQYKKELALRCDEYKKFYDGITYLPTHGDYQGCQLVCGDKCIKAVIDFSSAATLPVVWEIMRSYVQSSAGGRKAVIDVEGLCEYVREYMKYSPLTKADLASIPYVYLFQLARSKYGYSQYLTTDSEDRLEFLQFAFWRTDMCREVEQKAENISMVLTELI